MKREGVTKASFCRSLSGLSSNSLNTFLASKHDDKRGNITYPRAYYFLEQLRIHEGCKPKSKARLDNEVAHPTGFSTDPKQARAKYFYDVPDAGDW